MGNPMILYTYNKIFFWNPTPLKPYKYPLIEVLSTRDTQIKIFLPRRTIFK